MVAMVMVMVTVMVMVYVQNAAALVARIPSASLAAGLHRFPHHSLVGL